MSRQTFTWAPGYGSSMSQKPLVTVIKFGDGYEARSAAALNTTPRRWDLNFSVRNEPASEIEDFLEAHGAQHGFSWTPPRGDPGLWVCREWQVRPTSNRTCSITAVFEEIFEY